MQQNLYFHNFIGTSNHQEVEQLWYKRTRNNGTPGAGGLEIWFAKNTDK